MAGVGASAYVLAPCPTCGLDWGTGIACQHCGQVENVPEGVRLASPTRRFWGHVLETALVIVTLGVGWLIWSAILFGRGQTPAKSLIDLRVVTIPTARHAGWWRMLVREWIAKPVIGILGGLTLGAVYFWMVWDKRNQELWDKVVDTIVVHDPERLMIPKAILPGDVRRNGPGPE